MFFEQESTDVRCQLRDIADGDLKVTRCIVHAIGLKFVYGDMTAFISHRNPLETLLSFLYTLIVP